MNSPFRFEHTYQSLGDAFFESRIPSPVKGPGLVIFNHALAASLGLATEGMKEGDWAQYLSGGILPPDASPIAQAYAGHQFGGFTMLGDGRAILLGEHITPEGRRFDVQLKGAGVTRYSRRGDGRATLRAMLREYVISEAMHHLGIPTSRSLAVTSTGMPVYRERVHDGAVLTRIAASHLRVGTFEYVRRFLDVHALQRLVDHARQRHFPDMPAGPNTGLDLLDAVMERQIGLIVHWMRVGFIHGVMNTDNMSISGETIDYGPCAFMDEYHPGTVFSSIDNNGRYAYANQPPVAQWNLAVLAETLLPLMDDNEEAAVAKAQVVLHSFPERYLSKWLRMMTAKLGLDQVQADDRSLVDDLLKWMEGRGADFTNTFLGLEREGGLIEVYPEDAGLQAWHARWEQRLRRQPGGRDRALAIMAEVNPVRIPRNHLVESALEHAEQGDLIPMKNLVDDLSDPYRSGRRDQPFQQVPEGHARSYVTYCGT
ncbi:MAG: protein adenylyltransferase SelO [Chitinophagaceae bacterium]|jgi:uncharacterized protein YdiU (UPF0061 family)